MSTGPKEEPAYEAVELSEMHEIDPLLVPLYARVREALPSLAMDGDDEIRCRPAKSLCLPLGFRGGMLNSSKGGNVIGGCGETTGVRDGSADDPSDTSVAMVGRRPVSRWGMEGVMRDDTVDADQTEAWSPDDTRRNVKESFGRMRGWLFKLRESVS